MMKIRLALLLALVACGAQPKGQTIQRTQLDAAGSEKHKALVAEGDALWKERLDETKLRAAIAKWEAAVALKSDDHDTYAKLARGNYLLADGFLSFDPAKETEFLATHQKGMDMGEKGMLAISPDFEKKRRLGAKMEDAILVLQRDAVPNMYWYASNLGKWAKFKGIQTTLKYKDTIFGVVSRVKELDPDYFYAAPDRYFGGYYAVAPNFAGGDLDKSEKNFAESVKKYPYYLATHVLIAELLAPKRQDRALFDRELKFVMDTPADSMPDVVPEQTLEKKKAERLMKQADDLFQ
jgi:hypothetical protein